MFAEETKRGRVARADVCLCQERPKVEKVILTTFRCHAAEHLMKHITLVSSRSSTILKQMLVHTNGRSC